MSVQKNVEKNHVSGDNWTKKSFKMASLLTFKRRLMRKIKRRFDAASNWAACFFFHTGQTERRELSLSRSRHVKEPSGRGAWWSIERDSFLSFFLVFLPCLSFLSFLSVHRAVRRTALRGIRKPCARPAVPANPCRQMIRFDNVASAPNVLLLTVVVHMLCNFCSEFVFLYLLKFRLVRRDSTGD